jgi:hypothetical protein
MRSRDKLYPEGLETDIFQVDPAPLLLLIKTIEDLRKQVRELSR